MAWISGLLNPLNNLIASKDVASTMEDSQDENDQNRTSKQPSPDIEDLVDNMNKTAGKHTAGDPQKASHAVIAPHQQVSEGYQKSGIRRSPRKRPFPEPSSEKPLSPKRARPSEPESARRGLQCRSKSPQPRPNVRSKRVYDMEVDDSEEATVNKTHNLRALNKKQRNLQKAKPCSSPLKNKGTIDMPETHKVSLEDSPSKKPVGRARTTVTVGRLRSGAQDVGTKSAASNQRVAKEVPQQQVIAAEKPATNPSDDESVELAETDMDVDDVDEAQIKDLQRGKQKQKREAEIRERCAKELEGLECVTNSCGGRSAWGKFFVGSAVLEENRSHINPESEKGTEIHKDIKMLRLRLRDEAGDPVEGDAQPSRTIAEDANDICTAILGLPRRRQASDREIKRRAKDLYEHIVPALARTLKSLLKRRQKEGDLAVECWNGAFALLDATYQAADLACNWKPRPSTLGKGARKSMRLDVRPSVSFLRKTFENSLALQQHRIAETDRNDRFYEIQKLDPLHDKLRRYASSIINNVQRPAQEAIGIALSQSESVSDSGIVVREIAPPKDMTEQERNDRFYNEFQKRDWDNFMSDIRQRRAAKGIGWRKPESADTLPLRSQNEVIDVDDIDVCGPVQASVRTTSLPTRSRPARAQTEEIPGPIQPDWTKSERIVFQNALQKYLSPARFEHILDVYGGPGGYLERHDLDSLMAQAKSIKQHMAIHLAQGGSELDWLRSVPS